MVTSKIKYFCIYSVLAFFTLSAPLGHFLKSTPLIRIGLASLASPLMIVYSELNGERVMSFKYELTFTDEHNKSKVLILDKHRYNEIASQENIFNRHIMILPYMAGVFMLIGEGKNEILREKSLRYGICNEGPFAKYLKLDSRVKHLKIRIYKNKSEEDIFNEYDLDC